MNTPTSAPPSPAAPKKQSPWLRLGLGCGGLIGLGCLVFTAVALWSGYQRQQNYAAGHTAYLAGDCAAAIAAFDKVLADDTDGSTEEGQKAGAERQECAAFQAAAQSQAEGRHGEALLAYHQFVEQYADSPLAGQVEQQVDVLFTEAEPADLASGLVCDQLDALADRGLIPAPSDNLPHLLLACGGHYEASQRFSEAVVTYERLRQEYADHPAAVNITEALGRAIIAEAQALGAGALPAPQAVGGTGSGPAVVVIQNDSPERLSLVFSGPDMRVEILEPCTTCENFIGSGPEACPEQGPIGTYTVPPGAYDVVVKSLSDTSVSAFRGSWDLASGDEYYSCFFLVTQ